MDNTLNGQHNVTDKEAFIRTKFSNGLLVLLHEIHTAPLISQWLWYRVGSRNEIQGKTGLSHWVEHMQFKGTDRFPKGVLDRMIAREGGIWNALTHIDWTTYYATMPADKIDLVMQLEADRMINSRFDMDEVESERTVILAEREGHENNPLFRLGEKMQTTAFQVHPYRYEVVGEKRDLHEITRDDLFHHYRTYYAPENAVLALAGDFQIKDILPRLEEIYAPLPRGETLTHPPSIKEPQQNDERRISTEGPGETTFIQIAYHAPSALDDDFFPFLVMDSLLTGPSSMNMFGGSISNKTSRLYQALVDEDIALSVGGGLQATIDPYLYSVTIISHPMKTADEVISAYDREVNRILEHKPSNAELFRAFKQAKALFAYGSESITNQAFWLGFSEMFASYEWFNGFLNRLSYVTPEDVQKVAEKYLFPENRILGVYIPQSNYQDVSDD